MKKKVIFRPPDPNMEEGQTIPSIDLLHRRYHSFSHNTSNPQMKTILKNSILDKEFINEKTFLTNLKEDPAPMFKESLVFDKSSEENRKKNDSLEIVVPDIPLQKSFRLSSLNNERRPKMHIRQRSSIDSIKLPSIRHNMKIEQTSRDQTPQKERKRMIRKEPMSNPNLFSSSSTRELMARLREEILEKHASRQNFKIYFNVVI